MTPPSHDAEIEHIRKRLSLSKPEYGFTSMAALYEAARTLLHILDARTEAAPETFGLTEYEELHARITAAEPKAAPVVPVVPMPRRHTAECAIHTLGTIKSCNCMPVDAVKEALILELRRLIFRWDDDINFAISDIADALLSSNILRPMPTLEAVAEVIYGSLPGPSVGAKPGWIPNGNSHKQTDCRLTAAKVVALFNPSTGDK